MIMKQLLKDIIEDQKHFLRKRKTIERAFPSSYMANEEIIIISGVRRCGKSVLLQQIRDKAPQRDYFFNFDDDRLVTFKASDFQELYEVFVELYGEEDYFFFDEIQNVDGWEHFVKRLYNSGKKVFITGSNAKMLSRELGTLLTGCYIAYELYPFSFREYLQFVGVGSIAEKAGGTERNGVLQRHFNEYLRKGGFPMYLKSGEDIILKTLYDNILYRDVMVRNMITNERELREMVYFVVSNIGKPYTYNSIKNVIEVKNPTTVKNYLDYVESTYLLFSVNKLDVSVKAQLRNPKKMYAIDNALVLRLGFHFSGEEGRLLENLVYVELRRRKGEIFYYNDISSECDFVVRDGFRVEKAVQVSYIIEDEDTKDRELKGLLAAMRAFKLEEGFIITNSHNEELVIEGFKIHIVSAANWLLQQ